MGKLNWKTWLLSQKSLLIFFLITSIGLYLRFYNFENTISFGWDQARDAWKTRDILHGQLVLDGPKTGIGQFHLGPLWFYLLAPFYYITGLNPVGALYLNILVNLFNFGAIFWVTKKIYNEKAALFVTFIYSFSRYLIGINQTPWNVSAVPGVSILIFYGIYSVVILKNYKWITWLAFLTGLFFHLHFAVVFLIPIVLTSLLFTEDKKKIFVKGLISLPLFLIWFIPSIAFQIQHRNIDVNLFSSFLKDYWIGGFHLKFFIFRLNDAFIQFQTVLYPSTQIKLFKFIVPAIFFIVLLFEKEAKKKALGYLMLLWFIVPAFVYALYGGTTSEYYVLINMPMVLYIVYSLQDKLINKIPKVMAFFILVVLWSFYVFNNTNDLWVKPKYGGLNRSHDETRLLIKNKEEYRFNEGDIKSYLYFTCKEDGKQC